MADDLYVLDTSAIFAFTDQGEGADEVDKLLDSAQVTMCQLEISAISLMEVCYITMMEQGENEAARLVGLIKSWPAALIYPDEQTLLQAGKLKASYRLSLADALIAAVAKLHDATLVHKDPELAALVNEVKLLNLPFKTENRTR